MRIPVPLALLAAVLVAAGFLAAGPARGEDAVQPDTLQLLAQRLERLERENAYLRQREQRLTAYLLGGRQRGESLQRGAAAVRNAGFTAAANPAPAREQLLKLLEQQGADLQRDLPEVTDGEKALLPAPR